MELKKKYRINGFGVTETKEAKVKHKQSGRTGKTNRIIRTERIKAAQINEIDRAMMKQERAAKRRETRRAKRRAKRK